MMRIHRFFYNKRLLEDNGERIEIHYNRLINFDGFDMYQKSHYRRYQYASNLLTQSDICGDFACGTGYGSVMLSVIASKIIGLDINQNVIDKISRRYSSNKKVTFIEKDILTINYVELFDKIISFETIEHFDEHDICRLLKKFCLALKPGGILIFSTPYMQKDTEVAKILGHHKTYFIDQYLINNWLLNAGFVNNSFKFQNYQTHEIEEDLENKDFIICIAQKPNA
ncbi:bifunctional 2-polyprenyl-6-hydroxyphenol methylase/3-demethylubiquinol 3-O-methyltransferase UbiG [Pedobacter sp. Leaf250]|uniref:class I SAM-dependent methyltransferase n=1 Tax=Pedobacter sp. Leaf250 TaxID=2876559 RepID=UPI001E2A3FDF|nr:class I SAM-dependent methyltransferase [Pedobacter sp. Leaf250]